MATTKKVVARAYCSPTLVFLAYDWVDGVNHDDFLGFAIKRTPGHGESREPDYLFNKIGFSRPRKGDKLLHSNEAPIQKFHWWDSGIDTKDREKAFEYRITPVLGSGPDDLKLLETASATLKVKVPGFIDATTGIGSYFNRAVVSAQAFTKLKESGKSLEEQMAWLANGMEVAIRDFVTDAAQIKGAIYHLTDKQWNLPALQKVKSPASLVYYHKRSKNGDDKDASSLPAVELLRPHWQCSERTKTAIMHDKFLVKYDGKKPGGVLMGSTNFTPEAQTIQANVMHTFESPQMAKLYAARQELLTGDPTVAATAKGAAWKTITDVKGAKIRLFFSSEPGKQRMSIQAVIDAVNAAKSSVRFCMFAPTDAELLNALFAAGDRGKMLFGVLNSIVDPGKKQAKKQETPTKALKNASPAAEVQVELFHRSKKDRKVVAYDLFGQKTAPEGFLPEFRAIDTSSLSTIPAVGDGEASKHSIPAIHIHHKFIVIDAETDRSIIFTGSANFSNNSTWRNDENLLEIINCPSLAQVYL